MLLFLCGCCVCSNMAELSQEVLVSLVQDGVVEAVSAVAMANKELSAAVVGESMGLLQAVMANTAVVEKYFSSGDTPVVALASELLQIYDDDASVMMNVFDMLTKLDPAKYPSYGSPASVRAVVTVMKKCAGDLNIQMLGSNILLRMLPLPGGVIQVRSLPWPVDSIPAAFVSPAPRLVSPALQLLVAGGAIDVVLANLSGKVATEAAVSPAPTDAAARGAIPSFVPKQAAAPVATSRQRFKPEDDVKLAAANFLLLVRMLDSADTIALAKSKGCVRAILDCFTRCKRAPQLVDLFCEAVELVVRDADVLAAASLFAENVYCFRLFQSEQGIFNVIEGDLGALNSVVVNEAKSKQKSTTVTVLTEELMEAMVLLEAVAVSHRLAALIVETGGVTELVRGIATLGFLKATDSASSKSGGGGRVGGRVAARAADASTGKGVTEAAQDELMSRATTVLTNILRTAGFVEKQHVRTKRGVAANKPLPAAGSPTAASASESALFALSRSTICAANVVRVLVRALQSKLNLEGARACVWWWCA